MKDCLEGGKEAFRPRMSECRAPLRVFPGMRSTREHIVKVIVAVPERKGRWIRCGCLKMEL
jgi:hypothetical protein